MQHSEGHLTGRGGAQLYYQKWLGDTESNRVAIIVHGAAEHGGRYSRLAQSLTAQGYIVAAIDHYGHGQSDGKRCCLRSFDEHIENLHAFRLLLEKEHPDVPQYLIGHSMGGLIAANYLLQHPGSVNACVLSGPAIMTELEPPWIQRMLIKILAVITPNLGVLQLDAKGVSRDQAEVDRYIADPLNHSGPMTARMVRELFSAMENIQTRAAEIELPLLLLHGGADKMTAPKGSEFLHRHVSSQDKELHIYPELFHEIFNEPEREEVVSQMLEWMSAR